MPSKRRFTVPAEVEAEPIAAPEPIAASVDHSSNGRTVPTPWPSAKWRSLIAEARTVRDQRKQELADIEAELDEAKFNRMIGEKAPELETLIERHLKATDDAKNAELFITKAEAKFGAAQADEIAKVEQKRVTEGMGHVIERMMLTVRFDRAMKAAGDAADALEKNARTLSGYDDVTKVALHRMQLSSSYAGAIFASAPALARVLQLERTKPFANYAPLAQTEARHWQRFMPVTIPEIDDATGDTKPAIDPTFGEHGALAKDTISTNGTTYEPGDLIAPEIVLSWPMKNRAALVSTGKLEFLPAPKPQQDSEPDA